MSTPTTPTFFTVIADYKSVVVDIISDPDFDPELGPITAKVTFTPLLHDGEIIAATNTLPRPTGFIAAPIVGRIDSDGKLKLRVEPDGTRLDMPSQTSFPASGTAGRVYHAIDTNTYWKWDGVRYTETFSYTPIRLLADTPLLELAGPLFYRVSFTDVVLNGKPGVINPFTFQAETSDVELNLITVPAARGSVTGGVVHIPIGPPGPAGPPGAPSTVPGPQGPPGPGLVVSGEVLTYAELPTGLTSADAGTAYLVGDRLYVWNGLSWPPDGAGPQLRGPAGASGPAGPAGPPGASGASGAAGPQGATGAYGSPGADSTVPGPKGDPGASGASGPAGATGPKGDKGDPGAGLQITGSVASYADLPTGYTAGDAGKAYFAQDSGLLYVWSGSAWPADGAGAQFRGPAGPAGPVGPTGADSTVPGPVGPAGADSTVPGPMGASGPVGPAGADSTVPGPVGPKGDKGDPGTTTWAGITDKPAVIAAGADALAARTAIGAADAAQIGVAGGMAALDGGGKVPIGQLPNSIMEYKGVWNAATNTPPLADGTGDPGDVHRVIVAGTHDFGAGAIKFAVGDYVVYSGTVWEKSGTTDSVPSVAGKTGDVVLVKADVGLANVDDTADAAKAVLSATKLATPRSINGVSFDGSADVTIPGLVSGSVNGTATALTLWTGTKAQYDAIVTKDASTVYAVTA